MKLETDFSFPVTLQTITVGKFEVGFAWVVVALGGAQTTGLALYAKDTKSFLLSVINPSGAKRVVFSLKEAMDFWVGQRVPAKTAAKVLRQAFSEGKF